ncbi:transposase [Hyella patelloides LEGE 07179]|uniref:Transposase n=1 Tax=Hyella patelloides LEGE 07179 TaxID=945734 RepID=A0A563VWB0_9CYAN|nr:RNA-guided endonuclease TnpB family protein [Hyella patelloides]VEP15677.1 transposase [Hyella patelloides LEGE 07179]
MLKAVKVRIYPTEQQKVSLAQAFGTTRWVWNHFLALTNKTYKETGQGIAKYDMIKELPLLKKQEETEWLKQTYSQSLQSVCLNLSRAFVNFFEKRARYPRFKSRHGKQSLIYPQNVKLAENQIYFPKLDWIDAVIHRPVEGAIRTVTITKNCAEQYYASVMFEDGKSLPTPRNLGGAEGEKIAESKTIGLDLGLNHFCITSDGKKFDNPRWFKKHSHNLKIKQQQLSRKQKGSNNRNKSRLKVAKVHNKITNCREDFHHQLSRRIVNENQVLVLENLAIKNMVTNHCLALAISQVGWGQFCTMLKYKAEQEGKIYLEVDRFFPSSKTCHVCLNQVGNLPLDVRVWTCNSCQTTHDRDLNAAISLKDEGLRLLASGTGATAYRPDVRPSKGGRKKSTTRQSEGRDARI